MVCFCVWFFLGVYGVNVFVQEMNVIDNGETFMLFFILMPQAFLFLMFVGFDRVKFKEYSVNV